MAGVYLNNQQYQGITKIVKARSPIILSVDSFLVTSISIQLKIWNGDYLPEPAINYSFSDDLTSYQGSDFSYDLSNYVREFLDTSGGYRAAMACWMRVDYQVVSQPSNINGSFFVFCVDGWTNFLDTDSYGGGDFKRMTKQLYFPTDKIYINPGRTYPIPMLNYTTLDAGIGAFLYSDFKSIKVSFSDGSDYIVDVGTKNSNTGNIFDDFDLTIPSGSNTAVLDCYTGLSASGTVAYSYSIIEKEHSKYDKYIIGFIDRNGTICYIHTNGSSEFNQGVDRSEYSPTGMLTTTGGWDINKPQRQLFNVNGVEDFTINTGWVDEGYKEMVREMMLSEYVFLLDEDETEECLDYVTSLTDDGYVIESETCTNNILSGLGITLDQLTVKNISYTSVQTPIIPLDSNMVLKQTVNDGMVNYELKFKRAYNQINNLF